MGIGGYTPRELVAYVVIHGEIHWTTDPLHGQPVLKYPMDTIKALAGNSDGTYYVPGYPQAKTEADEDEALRAFIERLDAMECSKPDPLDPTTWADTGRTTSDGLSILVNPANGLECVISPLFPVPYSPATYEKALRDRVRDAAPDMLAALKVIDNCVADADGGVTLGSHEMEIVRTAIQAAEG